MLPMKNPYNKKKCLVNFIRDAECIGNLNHN